MSKLTADQGGRWYTMPLPGMGLPPPLSKSIDRGTHRIPPPSRLEDLERRVRELELDRELMNIVRSYHGER